MKKLILLILVGFNTIHCFSQEQYIEVIVKDTVLIEPQEWIIVATIQKQYDYTLYDTTVTTTVMAPSKSNTKPSTKKPEQPKEMSLDDLKEIMLRFNGEAVPVDSSALANMMGTGRYYNSEQARFLTIKFRSKQDMSNFIKAAMETKEVETTLVDLKHHQLNQFYDALDIKLMQEAKKKADRLAQIGGKKAGNILSISEHVDQGTGELLRFFESIMKLDALPNRMERYFMNSNQIKVEKSLRVRFVLL